MAFIAAFPIAGLLGFQGGPTFSLSLKKIRPFFRIYFQLDLLFILFLLLGWVS
jgi:hypothetical protein